MRTEGLEPTRISPQAPKTCASANSATSASLRIISSGCGCKQASSANCRRRGGFRKRAYRPACACLLLAHAFMDLDNCCRCSADIRRRVGGPTAVVEEEPIIFGGLAGRWRSFSNVEGLSGSRAIRTNSQRKMRASTCRSTASSVIRKDFPCGSAFPSSIMNRCTPTYWQFGDWRTR